MFHIQTKNGFAEQHAFYDPRTFSKWKILNNRELANFRAQFGPDILTENNDAIHSFMAAAKRRPKSTIKSLMLDQRVMLGCGNYLANESLFHAGIHPHTLTNHMSQEGLALVVGTLSGFILRSISTPDHSHWSVFDREGLMCPVCEKQRIARKKDSSATTEKRSSYFCPECQPIRG